MHMSRRLVRALVVAALAVAGITAVAGPAFSDADPGQSRTVARKYLGR